MKISLYELGERYRHIDELLSNLADGQVPEELEKLMDEVDDALEDKVDSYAAIIRRCRMRAASYKGLLDQIKAELERVRGLIRAQENAEDRLKQRLMQFMLDRGCTELKGKSERFLLVNNGGKQPLAMDADQLPDEFVKIVRVPDEEKVRASLAVGNTIAGAKLLERGKNVRLV